MALQINDPCLNVSQLAPATIAKEKSHFHHVTIHFSIGNACKPVRRPFPWLSLNLVMLAVSNMDYFLARSSFSTRPAPPDVCCGQGGCFIFALWGCWCCFSSISYLSGARVSCPVLVGLSCVSLSTSLTTRIILFLESRGVLVH